MFNENDEDVVITSGAQQAIEVVTKEICNEGDTIICEAPTFIGSLNAFRSYNAKLVGVEMEDDGINIDKLEKALIENPRTAFIYLIPNFQNPTGKTMSLEKRKAVLALAQKYNVYILDVYKRQGQSNRGQPYRQNHRKPDHKPAFSRKHSYATLRSI